MPLCVAESSTKREDFLIMGRGWPLTMEVSRVNSAGVFPKLLSLCFLAMPPYWAEGRVGALAFGSLRFATNLLFLLSHDSHTFRVASCFAVKLLTLGV